MVPDFAPASPDYFLVWPLGGPVRHPRTRSPSAKDPRDPQCKKQVPCTTNLYFVEIRTWILHGLCTGFAPALPRILFSSGPASNTSVPVSRIWTSKSITSASPALSGGYSEAQSSVIIACANRLGSLIGSSTGRVPLLSSPLIIGRLCPYDGRADNTGTQYIRFGSTCQGSRNDPGFPGLAGFTVHAW